jgi:DNA-binding transcriptional ArsR family regulator
LGCTPNYREPSVNSKRPPLFRPRRSRMIKVKMTGVSSRLGNLTIIKIGQAVLISPCDTRMKILAALADGELTSEELTREIGVSYSTVMDHMDCLERLGVVKANLKREGGRRRIHFGLNENPLESIEQLFLKA